MTISSPSLGLIPPEDYVAPVRQEMMNEPPSGGRAFFRQVNQQPRGGRSSGKRNEPRGGASGKNGIRGGTRGKTGGRGRAQNRPVAHNSRGRR